MKNSLFTFLLLALGMASAFAQGSIQKSLNLPQNSNQYTIRVMNLNGKVTVKGHSGTSVNMQASKTVEARRNAERLEQEWNLVFRQEGNTVLIYADGPGVSVKQNSRGEWNYNVNNDSKDGMVKFDIELQVPNAAQVKASTINAGDVIMQDLQSDAEAANVNGAVRLTNMGGNVTAATVNGDVEVQSKTAPSTDTQFTTVNGAVRLTYPAQLAANIHYTSVSGDFYTDFDVTASPVKEQKRSGGGTYYKVGGKSALQVGQGGPKINITTVNGDMFLRKGDN